MKWTEFTLISFLVAFLSLFIISDTSAEENPVVPNGKLGEFRHGTFPSPPLGEFTHVGVDIVAPYGSNIYAFADGQVKDIIDNNDDTNFSTLGYMVLIEHPVSLIGQTFYTLYLHMQNPPEVKIGNQVKGGSAIIGKVGDTGKAFGGHTHFEIRYFPERFSIWGNIYGPGDQRTSEYFKQNWGDPVNFFKKYPEGITLSHKQESHPNKFHITSPVFSVSPINVVKEFVNAARNADFKKIAELCCKDFDPYLTLQDAQNLDLGDLGYIEEILREEESNVYPENVNVVVVRASVLGKMAFVSFFVFKTDKGWKIYVSEGILKDYPIGDNVVSTSFSKYNYSNTVLKRCMFNALSNSNNEYKGILTSQTLVFDPSRVPFQIKFVSFNKKTGSVTAEMYNVTQTETVKFEGLLKSVDNLILKTTDGTQWNLSLSMDGKLRGTIYTKNGLSNTKLEIDINCDGSKETWKQDRGKSSKAEGLEEEKYDANANTDKSDLILGRHKYEAGVIEYFVDGTFMLHPATGEYKKKAGKWNINGDILTLHFYIHPKPYKYKILELSATTYKITGISFDKNTYNARRIEPTKQSSVYTTENNEKSDNSNKVSSSVFATNTSNIYHKSNCPELGSGKLIEFSSPEKARKSGGVPCSDCIP